MGRNTAPAIALAAMSVRDNVGESAPMLVMPADHLIADLDNFQAAVNEARLLADEGFLVTFGIHPTHAETGYGYIRQGESLSQRGGYKVAEFVEKPDAKAAAKYCASGDYFWNSGMFMFRASRYIEELRTHAPDMVSACSRCSPSNEYVTPG